MYCDNFTAPVELFLVTDKSVLIQGLFLVKDQCRLDIRKYSFSQRTTNEWNKLSTDCVNASSGNMFRNKIYKFLREAGYTYMKNCWTLNKTKGFLVHLPYGSFALDGNLVKSGGLCQHT